MRYQKPHDYSSKEAIFINVELADTTQVIALGQTLLWELTEDSVNFTAGNLPAFDTRGYRVTLAAEAESHRAAGVVVSMPIDSNTGATNLNATRPSERPFELQVYGFCPLVLVEGNGADDINSGDDLQVSGTTAGNLTTEDTPLATTAIGFVGFSMHVTPATGAGATVAAAAGPNVAIGAFLKML